MQDEQISVPCSAGEDKIVIEMRPFRGVLMVVCERLKKTGTAWRRTQRLSIRVESLPELCLALLQQIQEASKFKQDYRKRLGLASEELKEAGRHYPLEPRDRKNF